MKKYIIPFIWVLLLAIATSGYALEVPKLTGYVNDYAGMLSKDEADRISRDLELYESTTSNQIFILTIPSLEGEDIEGFSIKVAENWKAGHKGKDNGIIITLAKADRKIRIEVGRGLEGTLTDLISGRIIDQEMSPRLKAGKTAEALETAIAKIKLAVKGEYKGDGKTARNNENKDSKMVNILMTCFAITMIVILFSVFFGRITGSLVSMILFTMFNHFILSLSLPKLILFSIIALIAGYIIGTLINSIASSSFGDSDGGSSGGGFISFGGDSDGSIGGGSFGGDGGGFGGGGADGSW